MKAVEKAFSFVDSSLSAGIIINIVLAVVIRAPMKLMWFMLNTLQILTHMPMLNINLPTNLSVCLTIIKQIASLNLIPQPLVTMALEQLSLVKSSATTLPEDDDSAFTKNLSANLALLSIAFVGVLGMIGAYYLAKRFPFLMKLFNNLKDKLMYGAFLTFYVKSFLKLYAEAFQGVNE